MIRKRGPPNHMFPTTRLDLPSRTHGRRQFQETQPNSPLDSYVAYLAGLLTYNQHHLSHFWDKRT